jgi:hypothetical protein
MHYKGYFLRVLHEFTCAFMQVAFFLAKELIKMNFCLIFNNFTKGNSFITQWKIQYAMQESLKGILKRKWQSL